MVAFSAKSSQVEVPFWWEKEIRTKTRKSEENAYLEVTDDDLEESAEDIAVVFGDR